MAGPLFVGPGRPSVLPATARAGFARHLALADPGSPATLRATACPGSRTALHTVAGGTGPHSSSSPRSA